MNDHILIKILSKNFQISFYRKIFFIIISCVFLTNYLLNGSILSIPYGTFIAELSASVLNLFQCQVSIQQNIIVVSKAILLVNQKYLSLYWFFVLMILIILFSASRKIILKYALLILFLNIILNVIRLIVILELFDNFNWSLQQTKSIVFVFSNLFYLIVLYSWFTKSQNTFYDTFKDILTSNDILRLIIKILFSFVIIVKCIAPVLLLLNFDRLIQGLLYSSKTILMFFGYYPEVFSHRIAGTEAGIQFAKQCLGITLMLVFSSFVYFTGKKIIRKMLFVFSGVILINVLNIFRFVFLYIYIAQGNHKITNIMVHDFYNVILYLLVFLMWILWIEKFSDNETIIRYLKRK